MIAHTIKGKGIKFMENNNLWHYKNPNDKEFKDGLNQIKMRKEFINNLIKLNKKRNIFLIVNDLGFNVVESFQKKI